MNETIKSDTNAEKEVQETFLKILAQDVILSLERHDIDPTQANKRDLVRSIFAAIEGLSWSYRESVRSVANDVDPLSPIQELALAEKTYSVDEQGKIQEQTRFVTIPAMIRLATRLAKQICPELVVDFSVAGWADLKQAIKVRNRITHPKSLSDLEISMADVALSQSGLFWFLSLVGDVMRVMISAQTAYLTDFRHLANLLSSGDEKTLAEYRAVFTTLQD